ncbi:MAG: DUF892 family protein [Bacteroidetes bacterium]|nr:DUF892 family protein [Bacteroidota bacterium]HET6243408.1 DUF892 family protein [Bacteroidia bacterium]
MTNTNNNGNDSLNYNNNTVKELFINELEKALSMETMHVKILSKLTQAASNSELREMFDDHFDITEVHVNRIEEIFRLLDRKVQTQTNEPMEMLCKEAEQAIEEDKEDFMKDSILLNIAQKMEHLEISFYKGLFQFLENIPNKDVRELLQVTMEEEEHIERIFNGISESTLAHV